MSSPRFFVWYLAVAFGVAMAPAFPAMAQRAPERAEPSGGDLTQAFESAQASAKGSDSLDAAYELLGIAGSSQQRNAKALSDKASAAFVDLVQRSSAAALRKGGTTARDTLDQLVDLRFFARSQELTTAMNALDTALRSLFPAVAQALEQRIDTATEFDDQIESLNDYASLQASAAQVLMNDIATRIGSAIDTRLVKLETAANQATDAMERGRRVNAVAESKRARDGQVADATANNVDAVASQLKASGNRTEESTRAPTGEEVRADLIGESSCIETGYHSKPSDPQVQRTHDRECINSGRVPTTTNRCPMKDLSLTCFEKFANNGETIIYIYHNTPEEDYFRSKCGKEDLIPGDRIPASGATFRGKDTTLAFVCAPSGHEVTRD